MNTPDARRAGDVGGGVEREEWGGLCGVSGGEEVYYGSREASAELE
jgi:hypothetical protein